MSLRADAERLRPTAHSLAKMSARGVSWADVVETVRDASVVYGSDRGRVHQRGDLGVVVARDGAVVTVLLAERRRRWTDADARARGGAR
ncbi:hypothetical protein [Knoellia koreensis]|uniref:DUF4258 domain-containing protein n=1 Tax=Knoellia koreensis TaxID=2730921 RepID=A0A849HBU1_9MICO|nr:hypothetical protein [Knoellia sp. DB2414S]NNM44519.1 hypothetical protein [Knoellia sp. DB2414S]